MKLSLVSFDGSVERLAWAKANGCLWGRWTCVLIAEWHVDVLQWARERHCPLREEGLAHAPPSTGAWRS